MIKERFENIKSTTMQPQILKLRMLSIAYQSALAFDYCPEADKAEHLKANGWFAETYTITEIENALNEYSGCRPDELADRMAESIALL
jgi:hypothetical protein